MADCMRQVTKYPPQRLIFCFDDRHSGAADQLCYIFCASARGLTE